MKLNKQKKQLLTIIQNLHSITKEDSYFLQMIELQQNYDFIQKVKLNMIRDKYYSELRNKYILKGLEEKSTNMHSRYGYVQNINTMGVFKGELNVIIGKSNSTY